jgi:Zn-dependent protease with chaperone function
MKNTFMIRKHLAGFMAILIAAMPMLVLGQQTQVSMPNNRYKVEEDVKLGRETAVQVEQQFPLLNDRQAVDYVQGIGRRLVESIPRQFNQPAFDYRFQIVNASDLNAFALPGGPMYVNRGMIEKARNEGEMAGVMAHEISHIALRHATAQATRQSSAKNTLGMLGMILGGAILGGQTGAQIGMLGAAAWMTKYSREYETQADVLGSQIMANAGYNPRDLANVFRTIAEDGKGRGGPEWLSSHPDPGNRYEKINREAQFLTIRPYPNADPRAFGRIQERLRSMPPARTMAEIERDYKAGQGQQGGQNPTAGGRYTNNVQFPSSRMRVYSGLNWLRVNVPTNWRDFPSGDSVMFAPDGAYGDQGITRGAMLGIYRGSTQRLENDTQEYIRGILQANPFLRQQTQLSGTTVARRQGATTTLAGRSPVTGRNEIVYIHTTMLRSGELFYVASVTQEDELSRYQNTFRNLLNSITLNDGGF